MPLLGRGKQKAAGGGAADVGATSADLHGHVFKVADETVCVERRLAEGGFAIVYVVRHVRSGRLLALKRQFINDDPRQCEACRREAQIVKSLSDHKNIVSYVASSLKPVGDGVHEYMLLTEFYKHSVLALMNERLMAGRCLSIQEVLAIFCDMCEAVSRLHHAQTPVTHRDLKVENILIQQRRSETVFVLCDFGSATTKVYSTKNYAHAVVEEEVLKYTTLSYRAPEMIDLYAAKPISTKSDIWAMGVMLFKLCYFSLPFGESALAIQNGSFSFPEQPDYPLELKALIRYLLEPDQQLRPDVFQVSSMAFQLAGKRSPVANLHNTAPTSMAVLLRLLSAHEGSRQSASDTRHNGDYTETATTTGETTVAPRLRPKAVSSGAKPLAHALKDYCPAPPDHSAAPTQAHSAKVPQPHMPHCSFSNPDLASTADAAAPPTRPEELGFRDLECPTAPATGEPLSPSANPFIKQSPFAPPPADAPPPPPPPPPPVDPVRRHRRNVSDTPAARLHVAAVSQQRLSAFKPYRSSQPDSLDCAPPPPPPLRQSPLGSPAAEHAGATVIGVEAATAAGEQQNNPFVKAPFESAPPPSQPVKTCMDDAVFGEHFDELPRKRAGSLSSTSNVKSSESLVMTIDENDPFGAAPFQPPRRLAHPSPLAVSVTAPSVSAKPPPSTAAATAAVEMSAGSGDARYHKLVDSEDEAGAPAYLLKPPSAGRRLADADSVGSATDLAQRMLQTSTTDDSERELDDDDERRLRVYAHRFVVGASSDDDDDGCTEPRDTDSSFEVARRAARLLAARATSGAGRVGGVGHVEQLGAGRHGRERQLAAARRGRTRRRATARRPRRRRHSAARAAAAAAAAARRRRRQSAGGRSCCRAGCVGRGAV